ncbi:thioredoxin-dependent thiol peroxidase [Draconibacterium halophilum]|uniref:thioredoxin-dependent peroxiredoxin n=1 Tax=Draconibacterium halophilum TaxID=2706887 RepID=A0A6C0RFR8_9BACT|nr:thioredoxin-dependent thiol peroxidase [Draconibacterium halophilum]QIA08989.1 thioredoxin-dependent thiol peroxidase [Draconibacterium halophilum]
MADLKVGDKAPEFEGKNQNGEKIALKDFAGKKLILYFYPKDNTPGCTAESCNLNDNYDAWLEKGFEVVGVSPDSEKSHQKFIEKFGFKFDLIADTEKEILQAFGAWGLKKNYGREYMGVLRKTFVIDEEGVIVDIFEKVKTKDHTNQIIESLNL